MYSNIQLQEIAFLMCSFQIQVHFFLWLELLEEEEKNKKKEKPRKKRKRTPRRWYVKPWNQERSQYGHYHQLLPELRVNDPDSYRNYLRMDDKLFQDILARIRPHIERQQTNLKKPLEPGLRLAMTLRFLATGETYKSMALNFRTGHSSWSNVVPETCEAIIQEFMAEVIACPTSEEEWKEVAREFESLWQFHHTLGAIDGKHVAIRAPNESGSYYFNYKGYHSVVLLALVDAKGKFLYVDMGANGSSSDAGIFQVTHLRDALERNRAHLPPPEPLPGDDHPVPYFIIGDSAFPMREWLQKPYPQRGLGQSERNFNFRLSRARRVVENAFGMLANRFRVLMSTINLQPDKVNKVVLACCILHNLLRDYHPNFSVPEHDPTMAEEWTPEPLDGLEARPRQTGSGPARAVRNYLTDYYNREGNRLPWQR